MNIDARKRKETKMQLVSGLLSRERSGTRILSMWVYVYYFPDFTQISFCRIATGIPILKGK